MIHDISCKTFIFKKLLGIRFDKAHGFIKIHGGTRYLVLFCLGWYDAIYNRIRYLISEKNVLQIVLIIILARSRIESYNSLPIKKILTFQVL